MKPTLDYIKNKFDEYNKMVFNGQLKPIRFQLSKARTFIGQINFKRRHNNDGTFYYYDFIFKISTLIDRDETIVEDTILHEMIHYYILSNQLHDTSPHGRIFKQMMNDINRRYNRNIQISHKRTAEEKANDTQIRNHLVCVIKLKTGETGLIIPTQTRLFKIWEDVAHTPAIINWKWYLSRNPKLNSYKRTISMKYYAESEDTIKELMLDARPLVKEGNVIMVSKT